MDTRIYVKKKDGFLIEQISVQENLKSFLNLNDDFRIELYNIYDIFNADDQDLELLKKHVLSEIVTDEVFDHVNLEGKDYIAYEYLPGQYDQRADSAMQCLMLLNSKEDVRIHSGTLMVMENVTEAQKKAIENYLINPVEARKKDLDVLEDAIDLDVRDVEILDGFCMLSEKELTQLHQKLGLAMSEQDLAFIQKYFNEDEQRDPTITEIRVLDTYWSDHCRHTTFETILENIEFKDDRFASQMQKAFEDYLQLRRDLHRDQKPVTLMDMATIAKRKMKVDGILDNEEISDEINACSIEIEVDVNGKTQPWLLMFKNETHNHPTEIEPFGGASTCIGGAIRDPLSGRAYVYQAMRITGAGDITAPLSQTLAHKLPQSKLSKSAARGYSSYGNQIGLATTFVEEIFDEGYTAKRMEVGAVAGAAPKSNVKREKPASADLIVLIGGATGRDGIGGATGSSKEHDNSSLEKCSSEVQKGNAITERKLQRLFRNPAATRLIKKANDFGAGGVCVAVGELAEGLDINLDVVPVKYEGLDGTELAISESQERMAVCIAPEDLEAFMEECHKENLDGVVVAQVNDSNRLVMKWRGKTIVDLDRAFLDTNGVRQKVDVKVEESSYADRPFDHQSENLKEVLSDPNIACQIGLGEMFDASIGKSTVLMPYGGKYQRTPEEGSVQKLPVLGKTDTCSFMTYGFDPSVFKYSPYLGAQYSVVEALCKLAAMGADCSRARLSNQEYFERLGSDPCKWGAPFQALLGLVEAQMAFETPSIGGKDSMSGTFNDIHVPPTLITFAVSHGKTDDVISSAFKKAGHPLYLIRHTPKENHGVNYTQIRNHFRDIEEENKKGNIAAAKALKKGGISAAAAKMAFGNNTGAVIEYDNPADYMAGSFLIEAREKIDRPDWIEIGCTTQEPILKINDESLPLHEAFDIWTSRYDGIYPRTAKSSREIEKVELCEGQPEYSREQVDKPVVVIPVFPGQNCEYDCAAQFERAGADVHIVVFNNLNAQNTKESLKRLTDEIEKAQILMIAGGFSLGDEPDGSGKFIANVLQNEQIARAIDVMRANDGLILGICNGFQALIKSGLLPYGDVSALGPDSPTLFRNDINRHVSHIAKTRITSTKSPWLQNFKPGAMHSVAISHGEGKFTASDQMLRKLAANGQIATQYVNENGEPSMDGEDNRNGSFMAIEGILSEDGRILGKMGHSERYEEGLFLNIDGNKEQNIFENGVRFFTHR